MQMLEQQRWKVINVVKVLNVSYNTHYHKPHIEISHPE